MTFNESKEGTSGEFYVDVAFNPEQIGDSTTKTITFAENGTTLKDLLVKFIDDKEIKFKFITGVYLSDKEFKDTLDFKDESFENKYKSYLENHLNKDELSKDSQMFIGYKFKIPQDQVIAKGKNLR